MIVGQAALGSGWRVTLCPRRSSWRIAQRTTRTSAATPRARPWSGCEGWNGGPWSVSFGSPGLRRPRGRRCPHAPAGRDPRAAGPPAGRAVRQWSGARRGCVRGRGARARATREPARAQRNSLAQGRGGEVRGELQLVRWRRRLEGSTRRVADCSAAITTIARQYRSPGVVAPSTHFHSHAIAACGSRGLPQSMRRRPRVPVLCGSW